MPSEPSPHPSRRHCQLSRSKLLSPAEGTKESNMVRKESPGEVPSIACIRCRHRKKKCDHALPKCSECRRAGSECVRFQERKPRDASSVPWEYVKGLEGRLAQVEKNLASCMTLLRKQGNPNQSPAGISSSQRSFQGISTPEYLSLGNFHESSASPSNGALGPSPDRVLIKNADTILRG